LILPPSYLLANIACTCQGVAQITIQDQVLRKGCADKVERITRKAEDAMIAGKLVKKNP